MRCGGTTEQGDRCKRWVYSTEATRCAQHEPLDATVRRAGRLALAAVIEQMARQAKGEPAWVELIRSDRQRRIDLATHRDLAAALQVAAGWIAAAWRDLEEIRGPGSAERTAHAMGIVLADTAADEEKR